MPEGIHDYIARNLTNVVQEDDIVFMSDSFDVWLQQSPKALVRRFRELDSKIAIGIDIYCWPNDPNSPECLNAPNSTLPDAIFGPEYVTLSFWASCRVAHAFRPQRCTEVRQQRYRHGHPDGHARPLQGAQRFAP